MCYNHERYPAPAVSNEWILPLKIERKQPNPDAVYIIPNNKSSPFWFLLALADESRLYFLEWDAYILQIDWENFYVSVFSLFYIIFLFKVGAVYDKDVLDNSAFFWHQM